MKRPNLSQVLATVGAACIYVSQDSFFSALHPLVPRIAAAIGGLALLISSRSELLGKPKETLFPK